MIAEHLERVERGEIDRLMLLIPPRHGKSELASRRFPAWFLGKHPEKQFISSSATQMLAQDFGRDVRNIILSPEYGQVFDTRMAEDLQAQGRWATDKGGSYFAVGIGGALMGRGAHVFLVDDPFASMADARSELLRKNVWDWFSGTAYNRLEKNGAIVVINHRMHEDDLSGMLISQQAAGGDQWTVVELKAIDDEGHALWPEKYDLKALARIRANIMPADWSSLYQQDPTPDEGTFFLADWLRPYIHAPARSTMMVYGASDYATTSDGGDFTVHLVVGIDPQWRIYLLDMWRGQTASNVWVESMLDLAKQWGPMGGWAEETGQIKNSMDPIIRIRMQERQTYFARAQFPTRGDKAVRAQSIRARMAVEGLYVPVHKPWYPEFRAELLNFPAGKHDDCVDALGLIGQVVDRMVAGKLPAPAKPPKLVSTEPGKTNVTLGELFESCERISKKTGRL